MSDTSTNEEAKAVPADGATGPIGSAAASANVPVTIIEPKSGWMPLNLRELSAYRELLVFLIWRDIKVRYKQTVLGAARAVIQPVVSMVIFSIIFGSFAKLPSDGVPYPIFVFAALLPWTFFANGVSSAGLSLISQTNLLTKVYFPRLFVPTAAIGVCMVDFAISFLVYLGIMIYYAHLPGLSVLLLPVLVVLMMMAASGVGYLLASITVVYRDFRHLVPFMMQAWMYATPVVYPMSLLPERYRPYMALNPMAGIIGAFRSSLLNQPMDWVSLSISATVAAGIFVLGLYNFRRTERFLADVA
jgi:lipopolysaccharide transport system permease protein